jgi:starch phosphorylase
MHDSSRYGAQDMQSAILHHLNYTAGKDADHATTYDWRMALSHALRDRIVDVWFASTRRAYAAGSKRVYYLSMEFLIGRLLDDGLINLRLHDAAREALLSFGCDPGQGHRR